MLGSPLVCELLVAAPAAGSSAGGSRSALGGARDVDGDGGRAHLFEGEAAPVQQLFETVDDGEVAAQSRRLAIRDDRGRKDEADVSLAREFFERERGDLRLDVEVAHRGIGVGVDVTSQQRQGQAAHQRDDASGTTHTRTPDPRPLR